MTNLSLSPSLSLSLSCYWLILEAFYFDLCDLVMLPVWALCDMVMLPVWALCDLVMLPVWALCDLVMLQGVGLQSICPSFPPTSRPSVSTSWRDRRTSQSSRGSLSPSGARSATWRGRSSGPRTGSPWGPTSPWSGATVPSARQGGTSRTVTDTVYNICSNGNMAVWPRWLHH